MKHGAVVWIGLALVLCAFAVPVTGAQAPGKVYRIGFLSISPGGHEQDAHGCPKVGSHYWQAIVAGLRDFGYVQGHNLVLDCRWTDDQDDRAAPLAAELVNLRPDLLIANGTWQVRGAKQATATVPIVMVGVIDPVGRRLVANLSRPGGNVTGLTDTLVEMESKRLQLLKEAAPGVSRVAVIQRKGRMVDWMEQMQAAALTLGLKLQIYPAGGPEDLPETFAAILRAGEEAFYVVPTGIWDSGDTPQRLVDFANAHKLPSTYQSRQFVELGGLMSYCVDELAIRRRIGAYVDKILKGASPGDLPVEQPTKFNLVVNLRTATALGLTLPPTLLMLADEVIH
ncbi:MAG TPA: ABC transporter substrate-binding protein [Bryobacteraceae bacterium]|nr:ABC transporter substrate-binding protein [Bryobacteraceae bacterium]